MGKGRGAKCTEIPWEEPSAADSQAEETHYVGEGLG